MQQQIEGERTLSGGICTTATPGEGESRGCIDRPRRPTTLGLGLAVVHFFGAGGLSPHRVRYLGGTIAYAFSLIGPFPRDFL